MMFDNTPIAPRSKWQAVKDHLPILLLVVAALGVAASIHLAAAAAAVVAAGHLVLAAALLAIRAMRSRKAQEVPR